MPPESLYRGGPDGRRRGAHRRAAARSGRHPDRSDRRIREQGSRLEPPRARNTLPGTYLKRIGASPPDRHAAHRHPSPHRRDRRRAADNHAFYTGDAGHAARQEDREPGRRLGLSPVLRRRPRRARHRHHLLRLAGAARAARHAQHRPHRSARRRQRRAGVVAARACARPASRTADAGRARRAPHPRFRGSRGPAPRPRRRRRRAGRRIPGPSSPVPAEHQIRGLGPITLSVPDLGADRQPC